MTTLEILSQVSEIEIHYKSKVKQSERPQITTSNDCARLFKTVYDENTIDYREFFYTMFLNRANKVLAVIEVSKGGTTGTVTDIKMILQAALKLNAQSIICSHNHPSGNLKPSEPDKAITTKIKEAAKLLDITLLDHIILNSEGGFFSFADEGLI